MVTALRRLGFDAVFDTDFGADLTIVEEAHELLTRLKERPAADDHLLFARLDQLPGEVLSRVDSARLDLQSPMSMLSALAKTYYAEKAGHRPEEDLHGGRDAVRGEEVRGPAAGALLSPTACPYTDAVLTTRELIWMIKCYGIDFRSCPTASSTPPGLASGAGDIFGTHRRRDGGHAPRRQRTGHRQARPTGWNSPRSGPSRGCAKPTWPSASGISTSAWPTA